VVRAIKTILIFFLFFFATGAMGCFCLGYLFHMQRTCEWGNIDNIELHTGVNIPQIKSCACEYDPVLNIKRSTFVIDKENMDLSRYISGNGFVKLRSNTRSGSEHYCTAGAYKGEGWKAILDKESGKLWIELKYKD